VLSKPVYLSWCSSEFLDGKAKSLWINAPAGSGKTLLCASITQHLAGTSSDPLAFFFFSAAGTRNDSLSSIRTRLTQLVTMHQSALERALEHAPDKDTDVASASEI
jgi:hypothetical protein